MSRVSNPAKVELWRDRCTRCCQSEMTTAAFCEAEGISVASLYAWRRKLGLAPPRRPKATKHMFQQLVVRSTVPALSARLPGGIELEVPAAEEVALRVVVQELVRENGRETAS